jgi:hypothetical protein
MKKLLFALVLIFSCSVLAAPPPMTVEGAYPARDITFWGNVTISGDVTGAVSKTQADETYYVRTGGDDNNDCLTIPNACATPQGAVDKIPDYIQHITVLDIGPGTFPAFAVSNKSVKRPGKFTIQGTLGAPTLSTGSTSGTWDGGPTVWNCDDSGQGWTPGELRGMLLRDVAADEYFVIRNNTGTEVEVPREYSGSGNCSGRSYEIYEQKTEIIGQISPEVPVALSIEGVDPIDVETTQAFFPDPGTLFVQDLFFNSPATAWAGFSAFNCYGHITRCKSHAALFGYVFIGTSSWAIFDNYSTGNGGISGFQFYYQVGAMYVRGDYSYDDRVGFQWDRCHSHTVITGSGADEPFREGFWLKDAGTYSVEGDRIFVDGTGGTADCMFLENIQFIEIGQSSGNKIENCNGDGIFIAQEASNVSVEIDYLDISNCGQSGIEVDGTASVQLASTVSGAGNGAYGLEATLGSQIIAPPSSFLVTGASGDFTINRGDTVNSWSDTDNPGESVLNMSDLTCVKNIVQ